MNERKNSRQTESLIPQARLLRLFRIIAVLKSGHFTIQQLADRIGSSPRTMYRYIKLLESAEFLIEQDFHGRYFIVTSEDEPGQAQFTVEETKVIRKLIQSGAKENPLKNNLLRKLALNSELDGVPRLFVKAHVGTLVDQIAEAIRNKHQVVLKRYHSANRNDIADRLVEPIHFGDNYQSVMALDTQDKVCKQFKLERIGEIVETDTGFAYEPLHKKTTTDIFGITGDATIWITLHLGLQPYLLLREEFPLSIPYTARNNSQYTFHGPVASYEGIGRFVLGFIDKIKVAAPEPFKEYIREKLEARWD